jgi:hypothetical protein
VATATSTTKTSPDPVTGGLSIPLTAGTLQLYSGDPGSADLVGTGFKVNSMASGGWPVSVSPGGLVNFSGGVALSNWGSAYVNGSQLHGDPGGPGAGRVWISGQLQIAAVPFPAPPPSEFSGGFQTTVTVTGSVAGFSNANPGQPALFTANVSGTGTASGAYRLITNGNDPSYLDSCCASVAVITPASTPSPAPQAMRVWPPGIATVGFNQKPASHE